MRETISHYRILERIGAGGMGEVYRAEDLALKRIVALKFLSARITQNEESRHRLIAEAQAAASLNHPHVATVYEIGEADDCAYIAMEYVEGRSLSSIIEQGPLRLDEALEIAIQVADAVKAAHKRQVVHCDIKSSNVIITPEGQAKVLDFGIARIASITEVTQSAGSQAAGASDESSPVIGTLAYMSPEQLRGEQVDSKTDIFSFGIVLFEMLVGRRPFDGKGRAELIRSILNDEPPQIVLPLDDAPLELESIIRKSLEKSARERYLTIDEMLTDLSRLKQRLNERVAQTPGSSDLGLSNTDEVSSPVGGARQSKLEHLLVVARRFQRWILIAATAAAVAAIIDLIALGQRRLSVAIDAGLLLFAACCIVLYLAMRRRKRRSVIAQPTATAFRGLLSFQEADRDRFYGRELDTEALFERVTHNEFRFGVLFGESGSGKTSLLKAGLIPRLWEEGYVPLCCRSYKDPLGAVAEESIKRTRINRRENESLIDYLERVAGEMDGPMVIVLDQFEEFFVNFKLRREREAFISFIAECHSRSRLPVKFLISIRSDFLYLIGSEFEGRIPEPLSTARFYHLKNFDQDQAEEIIEKSARKAGLPFEPGLSRAAACDLAVGDMVLPSELQIVGERLQSRRIFSIEEYRRAGGKESLVRSFLEDVIQASGDTETCGLLLRTIISDENTRLTLTLDEIAKRAQRSRERVEQILSLLVGARLVREIQDDEPWHYELMHEYLIEKINQITGRVMDATQRANRIFHQYLSAYSVDRRTRIPITKLWAIRRYSDIERGERERALLRNSLRLGLAKSIAAVFAVAVITTLAAAWLSVSEEWQETRLRDGHAAPVRQASFSPDGRLLVSGSEDYKVIVWDFASRERLATFSDHTGWVTAVAFSPDGKWFATGSYDNKVIVYDAARLEKVAVLSEHKTSVLSVVFSPDGRLLATAEGQPSNGRVIIWDTGRWQKRIEMPAFGAAYATMLFSPADGSLIAPNYQVWNPITGERLKDFVDDDIGFNWSAITSDAAQLVSIDGAGNVWFLDMKQRRATSIMRAHKDNGRAAAITPDGKIAATGAEDVILWDVATRTKLARLEHTAIVWSVTFSPDGRWLVSTHGDGSILIWDVVQRERIASLNEHSAPVRSVAYSFDGTRLASASEDGSIIIWNLQEAKKEAVLLGHDTRVIGLAFSPDGKNLASSDFDGNIFKWDVERRQVIWKVRGYSYCVAFSPDGRFVASSSGLYQTNDGQELFDCHSDESKINHVYGVAFSADGKWLALVSPLGKIALLDTTTLQIADLLREDYSGFTSVCFLPDGKRIITGDDNGNVKLWNTSPLRFAGVVGHHLARVKSISISPGGDQVASASDDQTIALWDVDGRSLITRIGTHTAPVLSVAFSQDGKQIASGEQDRSVRIYTRHRSLWGYMLD